MPNATNFEKHLILEVSTEIRRICQPLFDKLNLAYFNYSRIYPDGSFLGLMSSQEYAQMLIKNLYRAKILSPKPRANIKPETVISLWSQRAEPWVIKTMSELGIYHPIMLSEVRSDFTENFVFASKHNRAITIENYFNNLLVLQRFQDYFRSIADKLIAKAEQPANRIFLAEKHHPFDLEDFIEPFNPDAKDTIELHIGTQNIHLTAKQKECLDYLAKGLSAKEIALRMHISPRTVESHLEHIKMKLNVNFKSELLALWEKAFYL